MGNKNIELFNKTLWDDVHCPSKKVNLFVIHDRISIKKLRIIMDNCPCNCVLCALDHAEEFYYNKRMVEEDNDDLDDQDDD